MSAAHPPQELPLPTMDMDKKVDPVFGAQPPSYEAASDVPAQPGPGPQPDQRSCCRRRCRRFGHFLVAALFIWLTVRYFSRHCELRKFGGPFHSDDFPWGPPPPPHHPGHGHGGHRQHHQHHLVDACVESANWTEYDPGEGYYPRKFEVWRRTELSLPNAADDLFLLSRGFNVFGNLQVVEAADRDDVGVEVIVGSNEHSDLLGKMRVCTLRPREGDGHGVGIFTPRFRHRPQEHEKLYFNITVFLPEGKDVTTIPHFQTHLPLFHHVITSLPKHHFGSISLLSADSPIYVENVVGDKISVHTKNAPIIGTFNTSSFIDIETSNAFVNVEINAFNGNTTFPTGVNIRTSNSALFAGLALLSTYENNTGGAFAVHAQTSNSPLTIICTEQAPDARLALSAHTSNSPAYVRLHPAFEGAFKLRTSIFSAVMGAEADVEDPAGRGRERVVDVRTIGRGSGIVDGDVEWVPQGDEAVAPAGKVEVSTSHSPLHLSLF